MMRLLDIGNTRVKWATVVDGKLQNHGAAEHRGDPAGVLAACDWSQAESLWIAQVNGLVQEQPLREVLQRYSRTPPRFAHTERERGNLRIAYDMPERLGVDRYLMMLALWLEHRGAFVVAAAGTALTFDAVDDEGRHLGGLIGAGLATAQQALRAATRFEMQAQAGFPSGGLGRDTESCVREGVLQQSLGLLERMTARHSGPRVLTGGDAPTLLPHLRGWEHRPDLVLEGLHRYACSK